MPIPPQAHPKSKRTKKAFTLIELLVIIAILALLAAILFPAFARARENARRSNCQSNLKQIGVGFLQYTQDYDEKLPQMPSDTSHAATPAWDVQIFPYIKSTQLLACPSDDVTQMVDMTNKGYLGYSGSLRRSYGMAEYLGETQGVSLASIPVVSKAFMALEYNGGFYPSVSGNEWNFNYAAWQGSMIAIKSSEWRHMDTSNFLFADGHVKAQKRPRDGSSAQSLIYHTNPYQLSISGDSEFSEASQMPQE